MVYYELKKVFGKKFNKIALVLLAAVILIFVSMALSYPYYVDEEGHSHKGPWAFRQLTALQEQWAGPLTVDKIAEVLEENARINQTGEALSEDIVQQNIVFSWGQGFSDIRDLINYSYGGFNSYDYFTIDGVEPRQADKFYVNRIENLREYLEGDGAPYFSQKEKEFLLAEYGKLKEPLEYTPHFGWAQMIEYFPGMCSVLALFIAFLCAGIFSVEFTTKADAVFFSTVHGRKRGTIAKVKAGFILITAVYWAAMGIFALLVLFLAGWGGGNTMIQTDMIGWKSFYNITFIQDALLCFVGGYIGCLVIGTLTMLISSRTRSTILAVIVPFIVIFFPELFSSLETNPVFAAIFGSAPGKLLQISEVIESFSMYTIGGRVFAAAYVLLPVYGVIFLLLQPVLYKSFKVRGRSRLMR